MTTPPASINGGDPNQDAAPDYRVAVYRYGAPTRGGRRAYRLPDAAVAQLRLAHELGNSLVELSLARDAAVAKVWSGYPQVAATEVALAVAEEVAEVAAAEVQREKSRQRTRAPRGPAVDALKAARARVRDARAARKEAVAQVKDAAREQLRAVDADHRAAVKALYADFVQSRGLYWATYNAVVDSSRTADRRVLGARKSGRPSQRRFKRWDGSGRIAVQLQREAGDPVRSPALLASGGGKWRTVLQVPDRVGDGVIRFGLGSKLAAVEVPVKVHRLLPDGADVTGAELVVERVAGRSIVSVHVAARLPVSGARVGGPVVAVHLGWRRDGGDAALRVASWRSADDVTVPAVLLDIVTQDTPNSGRVVLPAMLRERFDEYDQVRSARDVALDELRDMLVAWLEGRPQPDAEDGRPPVPTAAEVKRWKSPGRFAALALRWRSDPPLGGVDVAVALEAWRVSDRAAWEREANGRQKALGRRRDAYRRVAAWLAGMAGSVVLDDTDLGRLIRGGKTGELPGVVEDRAGSQRFDAAPGDLRAAVIATCVRDGVPVQRVDHEGITLTHHACGHVNPADERWAASPIVLCDGCGRSFDQDANATVGLLARAVQSDGG